MFITKKKHNAIVAGYRNDVAQAEKAADDFGRRLAKEIELGDRLAVKLSASPRDAERLAAELAPFLALRDKQRRQLAANNTKRAAQAAAKKGRG